MIGNKIEGYCWISFGFFLLMLFCTKLILQLLTMIVAFSFIVKGLKILAVDRAVYNYSMHYFNDNFRR